MYMYNRRRHRGQLRRPDQTNKLPVRLILIVILTMIIMVVVAVVIIYRVL